MRGVLLLSHGSRDPRAAAVVDDLVRAVARRSGLTVRACHLDFTDPTPDVALRQMAADGFTSARVVPLLFTPGYHVTHDVPESVEASGVTRRLDVSVAPALVSDEPRSRALLLRALGDRLAEAYDGHPDALVLASAGSGSARARRRPRASGATWPRRTAYRWWRPSRRRPRPRRPTPCRRCGTAARGTPRSRRCSWRRAACRTASPGGRPTCRSPNRWAHQRVRRPAAAARRRRRASRGHRPPCLSPGAALRRLRRAEHHRALPAAPAALRGVHRGAGVAVPGRGRARRRAGHAAPVVQDGERVLSALRVSRTATTGRSAGWSPRATRGGGASPRGWCRRRWRCAPGTRSTSARRPSSRAGTPASGSCAPAPTTTRTA